MAFLISTSAVVTLTDLGNRILSSGLSSFDLESEFKIEELRYSISLVSAIEAGNLEIVDDGRGRSISGPVSNAVAAAFVADIFHFEDSDVASALNALSIESMGDITITSPILDGEALVYNSISGQWENQAVAGGVSSVNTQTGVVVLDTDDLLEGVNKFYASSLFDADLALANTDDLSEGSVNLYYTDVRAQAAITVAAGSANYLSITAGELAVTALAVTTVTVEGTQISLAAWVAANYTVGTEFQEGDVIVLTAITGGTETYIHNGGVAVTVADFSLLQQPNVDQTTVRGWFSATAPLSYNSGTGDFTLDIKANSGIVIDTNELSLDLGASAITGTLGVADGGTGLDLSAAANGELLIGNGSGLSLATITAGSDILVTNAAGSITINIKDESIDAGKLADAGNPTAGQLLSATSSSATSGFTWVTPAVGAAKKTWSWGASSGASNTTNRYLDRHDGAPTNQSAYVAWFACELRAISFATNAASTWTAEVYVNGASVATLASGGAQHGQSAGLSVAIAAGDRVAFYVNGTGVDKPSIDALFEEV